MPSKKRQKSFLFTTSSRWMVVASLLAISGCRGTMPTLGPISLQSPGRVAPPGTGSYTVPASYSPKQAMSPVNTNLNTGFAPNSKTSNSLSSIQSNQGWHAADLDVQPAASNLPGNTESVSQAAFARLTNRLSGPQGNTTQGGSTEAKLADRPPTWKSNDR